MVIKLCFVQFGLKSRACFQNLMNAQHALVSWVRFHTKIAGWHDTLSLNLFIYLIQRPYPLWSSTIWWPKYKILVSTNILLNHTVESQSVCKDHERFQTGCRKHIGTVLLKSKLTVTCVSILETPRSSRREARFSILETFEDRVSSFDDRGSSLNLESRKRSL